MTDIKNLKGIAALESSDFDKLNSAEQSALTKRSLGECVDGQGVLNRDVISDPKNLDTLSKRLHNDLPTVSGKYVELQKGQATDNRGNYLAPRPDFTFSDFVSEYYGIAKLNEKSNVHDTYIRLLGFDPQTSNFASLMATTGGLDYNKEYLIPRLIDDIINTGIREGAPRYQDWISRSEGISVNQLTIPYMLEVGNGAPQRVGEQQDTDVVNIEFEDKTIKVQTIGKAISLGDDVVRLTPINLLSGAISGITDHFIRAEDTMAVHTLLNGDQVDGSWAASSVGTETQGSITYKDIFANYAAMREIGRTPDVLLTNRDLQSTILLDPLFYGNNANTGYTISRMEAKGGSPYPAAQIVDYHGAFPTGQKLLMVSRQRGMYRVVFQPLITESERSVRHRKETYFMRQSTAFVIEMMDSRLLIDAGATVGNNPLDAMFDYSSYMNVPLQG